MRSDLFREQAIHHQGGGQGIIGSPGGLIPPSWSWVTWIIGLFMIALATFLLLVSHVRTETVRGVLRYDSAEARLFAQTDGYVHALHVQDGEEVDAGDIIAEIRNDRFLPGGGTLSASNIDALRQERDELVAQRKAVEETLNAMLALQAQAQLDASRRETTSRQKLEIVSQRLQAAEKRRDDLSSLREKGLVGEDMYSQRVDAIAYLQQDLLEIRQEITDAQSAASQASTEATRLKSTATQNLSELAQQLAQVEAQLQVVAAEAIYVVRAPHSGRVTGIRARPGANINPENPIAVIVPRDAELVAEFLVPSRAIGFLQNGQTVRLMYDAFPHQKFGMSHGEVTSIGLIGQSAHELGLQSQSTEPLYRIMVRPDETTILFKGKELPLQTGMEMRGEIVLEERRLAEWLADPLMSFAGK